MINWTPKRVAEVIALRRSGKKMHEIATQMSKILRKRVTKNSIVGLLHRNEEIFSRPKKPRRTRAQIESDRLRNPGRKPASGKADGCASTGSMCRPGSGIPRDLHEVAGTCQYLEGEPKDRQFCGAPAVRDSLHPTTSHAWCARHIDMLYLPQKDGPRQMRRLEDYLSSSRKRLASLITDIS